MPLGSEHTVLTKWTQFVPPYIFNWVVEIVCLVLYFNVLTQNDKFQKISSPE